MKTKKTMDLKSKENTQKFKEHLRSYSKDTRLKIVRLCITSVERAKIIVQMVIESKSEKDILKNLKGLESLTFNLNTKENIETFNKHMDSYSEDTRWEITSIAITGKTELEIVTQMVIVSKTEEEVLEKLKLIKF